MVGLSIYLVDSVDLLRDCSAVPCRALHSRLSIMNLIAHCYAQHIIKAMIGSDWISHASHDTTGLSDKSERVT